MLSDIKSDIEKLETDLAIFECSNFNARTNALDFIEFHIIDRMEGLMQQMEQSDEFIRLKTHVYQLKHQLENIDTEMFSRLDQQINQSKNKKAVLQNIIDDFIKDVYGHGGTSAEIGYDNLDILINRLLSIDPINDQQKELEPEMIFYQKTPARVIIELSKKVNREDVFFDIGSGLGQVAILVNVMSGAKSIGIEYEPSFCNYAKKVASTFGLTHTKFMNEDARETDYSTGTIFFLYTPFIGKMMADVLGLLQKVSLKKEIRLFTYGPCSITISQQNWLTCMDGQADDIHTLYEFKSCH